MSKSDLVVLGFLNHKPMHGYEMMRWLKIHHIDRWAEVKQSSVYRSLQRLQKQKYIDGEFFFDENSPPKVIYSINEEGKKRFRKILHKFLFSEKCSVKDFWIAIIMTKKGISQNDFTKAISNRLEKTKVYLRNLTNEISELKQSESKDEIPFFDWELIHFGLETTKLEINALENLVTKSKSEENLHLFLNEEKS